MYDMSGIAQLMSESDYVVSVLPLITDTVKIINGNVLQHAKPNCIFINIGRGATIDEEAVLAAINNKTIAGM